MKQHAAEENKNAIDNEHVKCETIEICSALCHDVWTIIIEFCDTRQWMQLSHTCKGINQFKYNRSIMYNKKRTLKSHWNDQEIDSWFQLNKGTLFNVGFWWHPNVRDRHFQYLEGIHTLDMSDCEQITDQVFSHLTGIHTLNMSFCKQITDKVFPHLTGIHTLDMKHCYQITDDALSYLTGIHTLDIMFCNNISDNAFRHLTGIHTLNISRCGQITDRAFSHLAGIQELSMNYCPQITDKAFTHLTGIHTLEMIECTNITDQAFPYLVGVHKLTMSGCDQQTITENALAHLKNIRSLTWFKSGRDPAFIEKVVDFCKSRSTTLVSIS